MSDPRPDDLMAITISFEFRAKLNPNASDAPPLDGFTDFSVCLPAEEDTAAYLETIAAAIREDRLYGFMVQECASAPVAAEEWIEKTASDMMAESNVVSLKPTEDKS